MKPNNLLYSLYKREHLGYMNLKKPLISFTLLEKINIQRLSDTFLGFSIGCDFIISVSFESILTENIFAGTYTNLFLNFNTSPLFNEEITRFHQIYLGKFENSTIHFHFYQSVLDPDFFLLTVSEFDSSILFILFGNMPQLNCLKCQKKKCDQHGIAACQSYQLPTSELPYSCRNHQLITLFQEKQTLVIVLADNENNIRFINFQFPKFDPTNYYRLCKYPKSMFPFSLSHYSQKLIENYCHCFYDSIVNSNCKIAKTSTPIRNDFTGRKCQLCMSRFVNIDNQLHFHQELDGDVIEKCHDVDESVVDKQYKRILLQNRESVLTCKPCNKKTYLSDISASYQNLILYKLNVGNSAHVLLEYDEIHGDVLGISNVDGSSSYQWAPNHTESTNVALINEELVINSSSWFPALDGQVTVHCLGMATGKLSLEKVLLIHITDEANDMSYLVELDVNTASVKFILQQPTSIEFCTFVKNAQICKNPLILDLNNDLQVLNGTSLESITDYSGLIELKH